MKHKNYIKNIKKINSPAVQKIPVDYYCSNLCINIESSTHTKHIFIKILTFKSG